MALTAIEANNVTGTHARGVTHKHCCLNRNFLAHLAGTCCRNKRIIGFDKITKKRRVEPHFPKKFNTKFDKWSCSCTSGEGKLEGMLFPRGFVSKAPPRMEIMWWAMSFC